MLGVYLEHNLGSDRQLVIKRRSVLFSIVPTTCLNCILTCFASFIPLCFYFISYLYHVYPKFIQSDTKIDIQSVFTKDWPYKYYINSFKTMICFRTCQVMRFRTDNAPTVFFGFFSSFCKNKILF